MRVLMFGWEFPPFSNGGLGTACKGLTRGLYNKDIKVTFVLPKAPKGAKTDYVDIVSAKSFVESIMSVEEIKEIETLLVPYISSEEYIERYYKHKQSRHLDKEDADMTVYGKDLFEEVQRYSQKAGFIAKSSDFDVIHAHDWMTYKAGIKAKEVSGKPLVVHIHATEFDRTGGHPNQYIYDIEREGMHKADKVIAVSNFTRQKVIEHYGIPPEKVVVVHNAVEFSEHELEEEEEFVKKDKVVLFLGRLTMQKGPEYFLRAAKKVLEKKEDVRFIVAGSGDMEQSMINMAAEMGIAHKVLFSGFLRGKDIDRAYRMADVYVMPSISEPFGITPLEAMRNGTPTIISKQSGVSEVIRNSLKVDFWDINQLASKIHAVISYDSLREEMSDRGREEVGRFSWDEPAQKCIDVYNTVIGG